jgi:hypothetical protein
MKAIASQPERMQLQSTNAKAHWDSLSEDQRLARAQSIKDGITDAVRKRKSENAKKQAQAEAAAGMTSLGERGERTSFAHWTAEQHQAAALKRKATIQAKRAKLLQSLHPAAQWAQEQRFARADRKQADRKGKVDALLKLSKYANHSYAWGYANHCKVKKEGVVYAKDANGVWQARIQGEGTSSSV